LKELFMTNSTDEEIITTLNSIYTSHFPSFENTDGDDSSIHRATLDCSIK